MSLGQRQSLALTRTLAADRPVLLLDEPTAHLDARSEARVLDTLVRLARSGRTVIVVAHRPSVLAVADEIVEVRGEAGSAAAFAPTSEPTSDPTSGADAASGPGRAAR